MSPFTKFLLCLEALLLFSSSAKAQIVPDSTLGNESSIVNPNQTIKNVPASVISGGAIRNTTLFHSLRNFNVNSGQGVYFGNPSGISNILTRVTGSEPSNFLGILGILGNANLFFINPNGIVFGPKASLDINGSFLASTANSIDIADGTAFSTNNPQPVPLLTVSVPIGVEFTRKTGPITVQGTGNNLAFSSLFSTPVIGAGQSKTGLRVASENTIALVGGDIALSGGVLSAPEGRIELGAVASGKVNVTSNSQGWLLSYEDVQAFQDIRLDKLSLADTSGSERGDIQLVGRQIGLSNGSFLLNQNQGVQPTGDLLVKASDSLSLIGSSADASPDPSNLRVSTTAAVITENIFGSPGNIVISSPRLIIKDGGGINARNFGPNTGNNVSIDAPDYIKLSGFSQFNPASSVAIIATTNSGSGRAGNLSLSTGTLFIENGGGLSSGNLGPGQGGDVKINAFDSVQVSGVVPDTLLPSLLSSTSAGLGSAGSLTINTQRLAVLDGGVVGAPNIGGGIAGEVIINASDFVKVSNKVPGFPTITGIIAAGGAVDPSFAKLFEILSVPVGNSGNISITTGSLIVENGAQVTVTNTGSGKAGELQINANSINLDNESAITASTAQGEGGNIEFVDNNLLLLQNNSSISASANGTGRGGNITVDTDLLAALGESTFTATSVNEQGGQITVNAQGVFLPSNASINDVFDASSQQGPQFDGVVEVNTPDVDLSRTAAEPTATPESPTVQSACQGSTAASESSLVNAGTGGTPPSVNSLSKSTGWQDPSPSSQNSQVTPGSPQSEISAATEQPEQVVQATGWIRRADGKVDFVTDASSAPVSLQASSACSQANTSDKAH